MGIDYSFLHAADLAVMLPLEARCYQKDNPIEGWTKTDQLIAMVEYRLSELLYLLSNIGNKSPKGQEPTPLFSSSDSIKKKNDDRIITDADTYMKLREQILKGNSDVN